MKCMPGAQRDLRIVVNNSITYAPGPVPVRDRLRGGHALEHINLQYAMHYPS